jgi:hypothetical protein
MLPFAYQVSSASDYVKAGAGYLAGQPNDGVESYSLHYRLSF